jgi:hypothetical protein
MTIEVAVFVAGAVLVSAFIWQLHRGMSQRLGEIQGDVNALGSVLSRVFLMQVANKTENASTSSDGAPPPPPTYSATKTDRFETDALQLEMEIEAAEIDGLCAKLIALVPPQEAAPLFAPDKLPSSARERRLILRHETSRAGKIILHHEHLGDDCTVSDMSPAGALLLVGNAHGFPEQFDLDMDGYRRRCTTRWSRLDRIGVEFLPAA